MKDTTTATRSLRLLLSGATAALLMAAAGGAQAQAYVNATVGGQLAPGVYGRIDIGNAPPPPALRPPPYETLPPQQKLKRMRGAALAIERARSLLTDWMEGNGLTVVDPEADAMRRQWIWR